MRNPEEERFGRLLSHRMRGFDDRESTARGLERALTVGVRNCEFDVRFTRDGHAVAWHDPLFRADDGTWQYIADWDLHALRGQKAMSELATLEEMCRCFRKFRGPEALLHVDVKTEGGELAIRNTLAETGALPDVVLVSWLPGALVRFHALSPQTPLCFSHLPLTRGLYRMASALAPLADRSPEVLRRTLRRFGPPALKEAALVSLHFHDDGDPANGNARDDGAHHNVCHIIPGVVQGRFLALLRETRGMVCVPVRLATAALRQSYQSMGVELAVYAVADRASLDHVMAAVDPDIVYVDSAEVLREAAATEAAGPAAYPVSGR
jgi:glycerophosphoryl diester phosphodiesterase